MQAPYGSMGYKKAGPPGYEEVGNHLWSNSVWFKEIFAVNNHQYLTYCLSDLIFLLTFFFKFAILFI